MNKDIVYIEWIDSATAPQGWSFESEAHLKAFKGVSVGYLYKEDEENVFIVPHIMDKDSKDPQLSGYMTIPKVAIIRRYNIANVAMLSMISKNSSQRTEEKDFDELFILANALNDRIKNLLKEYHTYRDGKEKVPNTYEMKIIRYIIDCLSQNEELANKKLGIDRLSMPNEN